MQCVYTGPMPPCSPVIANHNITAFPGFNAKVTLMIGNGTCTTDNHRFWYVYIL